MSFRWVINASPIISLARIGYHYLLTELPQQVVIPQTVAEEIEAGTASDPARKALSSGLFPVEIVPFDPRIMAWDLGYGETGVLSYAFSNPGWEAILDDLAARKCARSLAIPHKGTLAVVILAKQSGLIPSAAQVLRMLQANGFRLEEAIIRTALKNLVAEEW